MYILERHIGRYSALRPGAPKAGMHRGEAFYSTEDISELHTAEKWVQAGREVQAGELAQPFKVVAKRGTKAKGQPAKDAGDYEEVHMLASVSMFIEVQICKEHDVTMLPETSHGRI